MRCIICGAEMTTTTGGNYHCTQCGHAMNDLVFRPQSCDVPAYEDVGRQGWICPKCGKVWAPWVSGCNCHMDNGITITCGTTLLERLKNEKNL